MNNPFKQQKAVLTNRNNTFFILNYKEQFQGKTADQNVKYPKELGVMHPFDMEVVEGVYKKFGFVAGAIDKYVDFIVNGFYVTSKNKNAEKIIRDWLKDVQFDGILRSWTKDALIKGNGYLEIGEDNKIKILDSKYMWVVREEDGAIKGYNQYLGGKNRYEKNKVTFFAPDKIAHLKYNCLSDNAYGIGIIYPAMQLINDFLCAQKEMHTLIKRKANTPIIATVGDISRDPPILPQDGDLDKIRMDFESLNNKNEWAVGAGVKFSTLDFGNVGDKFNFVLEHDSKMLFAALQVPQVLMGAGSIPEGLAAVQMDAFDRNISSKQAETEKVIEEKIFKVILLKQKIQDNVEFDWGQKSEAQVNARIDRLLASIGNINISDALSDRLELELAKEFGFGEDDIALIQKEIEAENELAAQLEEQQREIERKKEEGKSQPMVPGRNAEFYHHAHEVLESEISLKEWIGFNFDQYLQEILGFIRNDPYSLLAATSEVEQLIGYLSELQIERLKMVLTRAFENGQSIREITKAIRAEVDPGSLALFDENGKFIRMIGEKARANLIARTETTRAANAGAIQHYEDGGIKNYQWVASIGMRTCPLCEERNGRIYDIKSHVQPPLHVNCRCTVVPVVELK